MKKLKFKMMANLIDGTPVIFDGEFAKDTPVYVIDAEGKEVSALDGEHVLEDGTKFITVEGKISEIFPAEEREDESVQEELKDKKEKMLSQEEYDALMSLYEQMKSLIDEMKVAKEEVKMSIEQRLSEIAISTQKVDEVKVDNQELITRNLGLFFKN